MRNNITELRRTSKYNVLRGFILALSTHLLLIAIYYTAIALAEAKNPKAIIKRYVDITTIILPPSLSENPREAVASFAPPVGIVKPMFGIPIPIPDIKDINRNLLDVLNLMTTDRKGDSTNCRMISQVIGTMIPHTELPNGSPKKVILDPDDYVDHTEDPLPIQSIHQLIVYPEVAKRSGIEGQVVASVLIGIDGIVEKVLIEKSDNDIFNTATENALLQARFTPARNDRTAVAIWWTIPISFKLSK